MNLPLRNIIFLILCLISISGSAQTEKVKNNPYIDQRRFHYGFMIGIHNQDISFVNTGFIQPNGEQWFVDIPDFSPGFTVGLVGDYAFTENFNFRITPTLNFGNKNLKIKDYTSKEYVNQDLKSNYISLPLSLKYSANRINNYRPYIMTGINPMLDLSKRKESFIEIKKYDFCIEVGLGCDFYLPYFKLIPELKFSFGLVDIINHNRKDLIDDTIIKYTEALKSGKSRMVSLCFYFE